MRFIVSSSALLNRLQTVGRVISSKNTIHILDCFLFEIQGNMLNITASDSETTMITSMELVESDADTRMVTMAGDMLAEFLSAMGDGDAASAAPVAPKRTQRVDDFADLDFGKIEL